MISVDKIIEAADLNKSDENFERISSVMEARHDVATLFQISANAGAFLMRLKMNEDWMLANSVVWQGFMGMKSLAAYLIKLYNLCRYKWNNF